MGGTDTSLKRPPSHDNEHTNNLNELFTVPRQWINGDPISLQDITK